MNPTVPQFVFDGQLTEAGQQVFAYMDSVLEGKTHDADLLNRLPGHIKYYFAHVKQLKQLTPVQFAEEYKNHAMRHAWEDMQYFQALEAQSTKVDTTSEKTSELEESLNQLKQELLGEVTDLKKQISNLKGQNTKLRKKLAEQEESEDVEQETEEEVDTDTETTEPVDDTSDESEESDD